MWFLLLGALHAHAGVVASGTNPTAEAAYAPRRVAVVVGIQDYSDGDLGGLRFPDKDAHDVGAVLGDPSVGGFDRVFEIHGAASTTRAALLHALRVATADLARDDTFLLYLSGHGTLTLDPIEGSRLWLLPSDGRLEDPEGTGIEVSELEEFVNGLPARRRVLVLDTCHNGRLGSKSSLGAPTAQLLQGLRGDVPAPRADREVSESEARLYAAQYYQPAMEDSTLQNGVYTHFLVEALTGGRATADLDRDGLVDVAEAHEYARDHTIAYTGGLQVPRAEYRIVGREDIYLSGPESSRETAERAVVSAYDMVLNRARLLVNGTPRGLLPGLYAVEPGRQTIEVQTEDGRTLLKETVRVAAGEAVGVESLLQRRAGFIEVMGGAEALGGATGADGPGFHPVGGSLSAVWVRPWSTSSRWRPSLDAGVSYAYGALPSANNQVFATGTGWLRGTWAVDAGVPYFGPSLALRVPYRAEVATGWDEMSVTGAGGLAAGLSLPVAAHTWLDLRADGWAGPVRYGGGWQPLWGFGVRAGVGIGSASSER